MALFSPIEGRECDRVNPKLSLRDDDGSVEDNQADVCTVARVERIALDQWDLLGRSEQQFLRRIFLFTEYSKGALAELTTHAATRRACGLSLGVSEPLEATASEQYRHFRVLRSLNRRLEGDDAEIIRTQTSDLLSYLFERTSPEAIEEEATPFAPPLVALGSMLIDVLLDTAFFAVDEVLDRSSVLTELAELTRTINTEDRVSRDRRASLMETFRDHGPETRQLVDATLDRGVMPCLKAIRTMQRQFDLVQMGLVPDECVARALERFFELSDSSTAAPRPMVV